MSGEKPTAAPRHLEIHVRATFDRALGEHRYYCYSCHAELVVKLWPHDANALAEGVKIGNFLETHFHDVRPAAA